MIDIDVIKEDRGRFSIEEVASENEDDFARNFTQNVSEFDVFSSISSFKKPKPHNSKKKEFVYKEMNSSFSSTFKCEVQNKNGKGFHDFNQIWNSFRDSYHLDESNLLDFNFHKEKEFMRITDFYETHSDFKDNLFHHFEVFERSQKQHLTVGQKIMPERCSDKNVKESAIGDKATALNSTLDSCLGAKKFCSIGTQTDAPLDPDQKTAKQDLPVGSPKNTKINVATRKKQKKQLKRKNRSKERVVEEEKIKFKRYLTNTNQFEVRIDHREQSQRSIESDGELSLSPVPKYYKPDYWRAFKNSDLPQASEFKISLTGGTSSKDVFSVVQLDSINYGTEFRLESVQAFTIVNTHKPLCEHCLGQRAKRKKGEFESPKEYCDSI